MREPVYLLKTAHNNLCEAEKYLASGEAVNWVPNKLHLAVMWAINAWLVANRHEPKSDWQGMFFQFLEVAPKELASGAAGVLSSISMLEGSDGIGWDRWKAGMLENAACAGAAISAIESAVGSRKILPADKSHTGKVE